MHIKQVVIEGFKTYKQRTAIDPFSSGLNVILGKNGSGKSNVFNAIQFVLSDKYSSLRTEDRQHLLHEGSGREVLLASVEVIFDNSDMRFPIESKEVCFKRTLGLKKDEYFINNKHVSKSEVANQLETAGLSRSNPYYIVEQGKVAKLIQMSDAERLELLKEIAGTRTYDERRRESLKIMHDTEKRLASVDENVRVIDERLKELQEQKEELAQFQELDTERRCLEYALYQHDYSRASSELDELDAQRVEGKHGDEIYARAEECRKNRAEAEDELKQLSLSETRVESEASHLEQQRQQMQQSHARAELAARGLQEQLEAQERNRSVLRKELDDVEQAIVEKQSEFDSVLREHRQRCDEEKLAKDELKQVEERVAEIYARRGRNQRFSSPEEHSAYLRREIGQYEKDLSRERQRLQDLQSENRGLSSEEKALENTMNEQAQQLESLKSRIEECSAQAQEWKRKRDEAQNARKELWRSEADLQSRIETARAALQKAERQLLFTMDRSTARGLQAVRQVTKEKGIRGVHGPLIELVECDSKYFKAVESAAGNALFHVVVDSDGVAAQLITHLNKERAGRVTFMPLNRLSDRQPACPRTSDSMPMVDKLKFDPRFTRAVTQVFGRTLIVRDLQTGAALARQHNLDTVTLDGDKVLRKGALEGGFIDDRVSRMQSWLDVKEHRGALEGSQSELEELQRAVSEQDQLVSQAVAEWQKQESLRAHLRNQRDQLLIDRGALERRFRADQDARRAYMEQLQNLQQSVTSLERRLRALRTELHQHEENGGGEESARDEAERSELRDLEERKEELVQIVKERTRLRAESELRKTGLESELEGYLRRRRKELQQKLSGDDRSSEEAHEALERESQSLEELSQRLEDIGQRWKELAVRLEEVRSRRSTLEQRLEELRQAEVRSERALAGEIKAAERAANRRTLALQQQERAMRKMRELGTLPSGWEKHRDKEPPQLLRALEKVTNKLKQFGHVNRKAIEQYMSFTQQREELLQRKEELDRGHDSIMQLIENLDRKKDEAIAGTFKSIAKNFSQVFSELVPQGKATLVIQTRVLPTEAPAESVGAKRQQHPEGKQEQQQQQRGNKKGKRPRVTALSGQADESGSEDGDKENENEGEEGQEQEEQEEKPTFGTAHYSGVGIRVSFGSGAASVAQSMDQLSGGQKTVVALSLIFAIQRVDPSPFYLFDEIDSALDAAHRAAVTEMIRKQKDGTQFICTTFRPEMLQCADKVYGVFFSHKISRVRVLEEDEAQKLLHQVEREMEHDVAAVAAAPMSVPVAAM